MSKIEYVDDSHNPELSDRDRLANAIERAGADEGSQFAHHLAQDTLREIAVERDVDYKALTLTPDEQLSDAQHEIIDEAKSRIPERAKEIANAARELHRRRGAHSAG